MKKLFNKLFKAIGSIIPHFRGARLISLDKNYTNKYNYAYNAQHIITSKLGALFSRRGLSPMAIPLKKLYNNILKISIISLFVIFNNHLIASSVQEQIANIYTKDDAVVNGSCSFKCREVKSGFQTQISGYDFANGVTYCSVKETTNFLDTKYNANQQNLGCIEEFKNLEKQLPNFNTTKVDYNIKSQIENTPSDTSLTLSRFINGLVTLDPKIINRDATNQSGQLVLNDGITNRNQVENIYKESFGDMFGKVINNSPLSNFSMFAIDYQKDFTIGDGKNISLADGFNKANMSYFSNLFKNMNEIYNYLQNLIFVLIGGFYLATLGTKKLFTYLEHREEQQLNQPYLQQFFVPLVAFAVFFMPIPEGKSNQDQATIVQNIIRFASSRATDIADIASAKGANTYINKIIASVGGSDNQQERMLIYAKLKNEKLNQYAKDEYKKCEDRYGDLISKIHKPFSDMTEKELEELGLIDINQQAKNSDISLQACAIIEQSIFKTNTEIANAEHNLKVINNFKNNDKLQKNLKFIDDFIAKRENELGWFNSIIVASSAKMIELQDHIQDYTIQKNDTIKTISEKSTQATKDEIKSGEVTGEDQEGVLTMLSNYLLSKITWFILPGSKAIYDIAKGIYETIIDTLTIIIGAIPTIGFIAKAVIGTILQIASDATKSLVSLIFTQWMLEEMVKAIPVVTVCIASLIASIGYIVSLCKYFYISPFVVAFALSTKQVDKITQFLINGLTIFLQPILIVLFIYLSLFLNTLISEFFILISSEQFNAIPLNMADPSSIIKIGVIRELIIILGYLASSYIMWKLIISGHKWVMDLIGINSQNANSIMDSMVTNLERRSFV
ncbi:hypothetical protein E3U40_10120 [Campylobacter fetus subsp. venerealis]|nr:hypothetical protein [Campylobacter fetus]KAA3682592.1 hypothetical protein E3U40_10120 [Campylobacter fetus subsp. venerealis]